MTLSSNLLSSRKVLALVAIAAAASIVVAVLFATSGSPTQAGAADHLDAPNLSPPGGDNRRISPTCSYSSPPRGTRVHRSSDGRQPSVGRWRAAELRVERPSVARDQRVKYLFRIDNNGIVAPTSRWALPSGSQIKTGSSATPFAGTGP